MSVDFFQTVMGRAYYEGTMPRIAKALERIATAMERQSAAPELTKALLVAERALDGDSNDAEHDALVGLMDAVRSTINKEGK